MNNGGISFIHYLFFFYPSLIGASGNDPEYEFVFTIPEVLHKDRPHVMISTTSLTPIHATVTIPGTDFEVKNTLVRDNFIDVTLPNSIYNSGTDVQNDKTVVVRASGKVSVHAMANEGRSGDGFLVLPTSQLGTDHYVLSYIPFGFARSLICVSAFSSKSTAVEIRIKLNITYSIELQQYESYQLNMKSMDLSGSQVISNHPVTVIAATQWSRVKLLGKGSKGQWDSFIEEIPPVTMWGTYVVMAPFTGKDNGYVYRILGTNVTTEATISNVGTIYLTEGQWYEGDVSNDTMVAIKSDYPILVMQYIRSGGLERYLTADSSMILALSTNLYPSNSITIPVFNATYTTYHYFINIITECNEVNGLTYDDESIATWERLTSADEEMCSVSGNVTAGAVHTVSHEDGNVNFTVSVYGLSVDTSHKASYAYLAGIRYLGKKHTLTEKVNMTINN